MTRPGQIQLTLVLCCVVLACGGPATRKALSLERAERAVRAGDLDGAEDRLRAYLRYAPDDLEVLTRLATVLEQQERTHEAAVLLCSLSDNTEIDTAYRKVLGRVLLRDGQLRRCLPVFLALAAEGALDPEIEQELLRAVAGSGLGRGMERSLRPDWLHTLVGLFIQQHRLEEAARCVLRLPRDDPQREALADLVLGDALNRGELRLLESFPALFEDGARSRQLLARHRLLLAHDRWDAAAAVEREFIDRYPEHPERYEILLAMARRRLRTGRAREALELANQAIGLHPRRVDALLEKALALQELGRAKQARQALELVLEIQPDQPTARRLLSESVQQHSRPGTLELRLTASGDLRPWP